LKTREKSLGLRILRCPQSRKIGGKTPGLGFLLEIYCEIFGSRSTPPNPTYKIHFSPEKAHFEMKVGGI
jgi:hypothetical protein